MKILNNIMKAVKKAFTSFLVVLTMVSSTFVMAPLINVSAATESFETMFSKQVAIEADKLIPYMKYDLNGKWYDNGTGYAVSNLATECNGYVRRTLVNTVYALEKQGVTIPAEYARLKTVTSNGLDMRGILDAINAPKSVPTNLRYPNGNPDMAKVGAYMDQFGPGTVVYFETKTGDRHWGLYAGKINGQHMLWHNSGNRGGRLEYGKGVNLDPFEDMWTTKSTDIYGFISVHNPVPPLPELGNALLEKTDTNGRAVQGAVFNLYKEDGTLEQGNRTTDSKGQYTFVELKEGKYYAQEVSAPSPLVADTTTKWLFDVKAGQTVKVSNGTNGKIVNAIAQGRIQVVKVSDHNTPLSNVVFEVRNSSGNLVDTITTNAQGIATSKSLPLGKYTYKEVKVPAGIVLDETVKNFDLIYKDQNTPIIEVKQNVTNKHQRGDLIINKLDSEDASKVVEGVTFALNAKTDIYEGSTRIYLAGELVGERVTDRAGQVKFTNLPIGTYELQEKKAANGYVISNKVHTINIRYDVSKTKITEELTITNQIVKGKLEVTKVSNHNNPISGVVFDIYNSSGSVVDTITTNESGIALTKELPMGSYTFKEVSVPDGYVLDDTVRSFDIKYKDQNTPIIEVARLVGNKHQRSDLVVTKIENDWDKRQPEYNGKVIEGVTFELLAKTDIYEGSTRIYLAGELVGERVTDRSGQVKFENLPIGLYDLQEVSTAEGYVLLDKAIPITIAYDKEKPTVEITLTETTVENQVKYGSVELIKTSCLNSCTTNELLPGATFELRRSSDDFVLGTYVSDENGKIVVQDLRYSTDSGYYFIETKAPEGYFTSDRKIYFDITEHHTRVFQTASNKPVKAHLQFVKVDEDAKPLEGVEFRVRDINTNEFITVDVVKGNKVEKQTRWTTDADGAIFIEGLIDYGNYELVETKSPEGFVPLDPIAFTIDENQDYIDLGTIIGKSLDLGTIVNEYIKSPILIKKVDAKTGEVIPGTVFEVYKDTDLVGTYTTGADGTVLTDILHYGEYTVKEVNVPAPYVIDPNKQVQTVNIKEHDTVYNAVFENNIAKGMLNINKVDAKNGKPVAGAKYLVLNAGDYTVEEIAANFKWIQDDLGNVIAVENLGLINIEDILYGEFITNKDGRIILEDLDLGRYFVLEVETPYGYQLDPEVYEINIEYQNQNTTIVKHDLIIQEKRAKGLIRIAKKDSVSKNLIDFAKDDLFKAELINADGTRSLIQPDSVEDGIFTYIVDLLEIYEFREENPPVGYSKSKEIIRVNTYDQVDDRVYFIEYFNTLTPITMLPPTGIASYSQLLGLTLFTIGSLMVIKGRKKKEESI